MFHTLFNLVKDKPQKPTKKPQKPHEYKKGTQSPKNSHDVLSHVPGMFSNVSCPRFCVSFLQAAYTMFFHKLLSKTFSLCQRILLYMRTPPFRNGTSGGPNHETGTYTHLHQTNLLSSTTQRGEKRVATREKRSQIFSTQYLGKKGSRHPSSHGYKTAHKVPINHAPRFSTT